jgi:hypothetical protein
VLLWLAEERNQVETLTYTLVSVLAREDLYGPRRLLNLPDKRSFAGAPVRSSGRRWIGEPHRQRNWKHRVKGAERPHQLVSCRTAPRGLHLSPSDRDGQTANRYVNRRWLKCGIRLLDGGATGVRVPRHAGARADRACQAWDRISVRRTWAQLDYRDYIAGEPQATGLDA